MKFILADYMNRANMLAATLTKMLYTVDTEHIQISKEARDMANDYLEMYKQYKEKLVIDSQASVYNGDINYDWFVGPNGSKVQGLLALDTFGRAAQKKISSCVTGK